jgi:hypothetical protein
MRRLFVFCSYTSKKKNARSNQVMLCKDQLVLGEGEAIEESLHSYIVVW